MARKYTSIWLALKAKGHCEIAAHVALHPRIIKAVIKEKDADVGYKIICNNAGKTKKISYKTDGSMIRFFLNEHIFGSITVNDL